MAPRLVLVRRCLCAAVAVFSVICLGIAVHFDSVLVPNELTRYVPLAIFAAAATLFTLLVLAALSYRVKTYAVQETRYELAWLGLLGVFWLALGAYMCSAEMAEVECFMEDENQVLIPTDGFSTEEYQAQYRVLQTFSLLNAILLLGLFLFLLLLSLVHHARGRKEVWSSIVSTYSWFHFTPTSSKPLLPVTAQFTTFTRDGQKKQHHHHPAAFTDNYTEKKHHHTTTKKPTTATTKTAPPPRARTRGTPAAPTTAAGPTRSGNATQGPTRQRTYVVEVPAASGSRPTRYHITATRPAGSSSRPAGGSSRPVGGTSRPTGGTTRAPRRK